MPLRHLALSPLLALAVAAPVTPPAEPPAPEAPALKSFSFVGCSGEWEGGDLAPEAWRETKPDGVAFVIRHVADCGLDGSDPHVALADGVLDLGYDLQSRSAPVMCECEYWATFTFGADAAGIDTVTFEGGPVRRQGRWR